jgi:hypothetical protein
LFVTTSEASVFKSKSASTSLTIDALTRRSRWAKPKVKAWKHKLLILRGIPSLAEAINSRAFDENNGSPAYPATINLCWTYSTVSVRERGNNRVKTETRWRS